MAGGTVEDVRINFLIQLTLIQNAIRELQRLEEISLRLSKMNSLQNFGQSIQAVGNAIKNVGDTLTENVTKPIIGGIAASVKASMDLEKQLSYTGAKANATGKEMEQLKDQSIKLGIATKYSALEVAQGQEEMIKAGRTVKQVFEEMGDVLSLAAAGNVEVARAAEINSNVMNMFSAQGVTATKVANQFAGAANSSAIDVNEFYNSLSYVGPVAASLGISLEDVSGVIGVLGNNAIKGSKAGTGLRQFLMRLQPASDKAAAAMQSLGLITKDGANQFYDAQGKMKSLSEIVNILKTSLSGLTDQSKQEKLKEIFGLIASPTVNTLVNQNADAIDNMKEAIGKLSAEEVAARQMDNLAGSIEYFQSTVEAISVKIGDLFVPILNSLLKRITKVLNVFAGLPSPLIAVGVAFALIIAAIGPIIMIVGTLIAAFGGLIAVIAGVAAAITIIGWPVILITIGAVAGAIFMLGGAIAAVTISVVSWLNRTIPIVDTLKLLKNLISGDLKGSLDVLVDKFGMSKKAANELMNRLLDLKEKARQLWIVLKDNLGVIFEVIGENIAKAIGKFDLFNNSTKETQKNVTGTFGAILNPIERLINYLYKLADAFGLIPTEAKLMGDKTATEYVNLNANVDKNLNQLMRMQQNFGDNFTDTNKQTFEKMIDDTKKALENEYNLVSKQIDKKKEATVKGAQELYKNSSVLTDAEEKAAIAKLNAYYDKQKTDLQANNAKILEITKNATKYNRELTEEERRQIYELRKSTEDKNLLLIADSKKKQQIILEEIRNQTTTITKQEALEVVVEANKKYTSVVSAAKKTKEESIASAILQRDESKSISKEQADALIKEANTTYTNTVNAAAMTNSETTRLANEKSGNLLTTEELLKTSLDTKNQEIKAKINEIWLLIKADVIRIVNELVNAVIDAIGNRLKSGIASALSSALSALAGGIINLKNNAKLDTKVSVVQQKDSFKLNMYAAGTRYATGGMALVGEHGAELLNLPRGSQVYNNSQTNSMFSNNSNSRNININYSGGVTNEDKNRFTNMLRVAGVY